MVEGCLCSESSHRQSEKAASFRSASPHTPRAERSVLTSWGELVVLLMALRRYFVVLSIALAVVAGLAAALPVVAGTRRGAPALVFMGAAGAAVGARAAPSNSPSEESTRPPRGP